VSAPELDAEFLPAGLAERISTEVKGRHYLLIVADEDQDMHTISTMPHSGTLVILGMLLAHMGQHVAQEENVRGGMPQ